MESLFRDMTVEQLESVKTKYPQYGQAVDIELARRKTVEDETLAKFALAIEEEDAKEVVNTSLKAEVVKLFPSKPANYTNLIIVWEEVEVIDGEGVEVKVNGVKETRVPKHTEWQVVIYDNVFWSKVKTSVPKEGNAKGAREVTVTKLANGVMVERWGFENGELACTYFAIPKDKGSSVIRLQNYRDNLGTRYMVDYGILEGVTRK